MQQRNLHDDAVVCKTVDKGVGQPLCDYLSIVVARLPVDIQHGFLDVTHTVPQQIDSNHGQSKALLGDIVAARILHTQILPEAQCLGLNPGLLQLDEDQFFVSLVVTNCGAKVDAKHRQRRIFGVAVFMWSNFDIDHILFEQCRQDGTRNASILHEILEHRVVYGVGNGHHKAIICRSVCKYTTNLA